VTTNVWGEIFRYRAVVATRGFTFASLPSFGISSVPALTAAVAEHGYDSFWVAETTGTEAFSTLALAASTVPGIGLGTGVLAVQLRTPMLAAMGAATLAGFPGAGPMYLGVGISSPVVVGQWHGAEYGDRPIQRMREYLTLVRECLSGESVTFDGDFWSCRKFRLGTRFDEAPKLVLGALNPKMLQLAGELADGVLLNYLPATAVPWCIEQVRVGEALTDRPVGSCRIHAYVHVGVATTDEARVPGQRDLFSYAVVPAYAKAFRRSGFAREVDDCLEAHAARNRDGALAAISDEMIGAIDICGDSAHIARAVAAYEAAGVDHSIIMPMPWAADRRASVDATIAAAAPSAPAG